MTDPITIDQDLETLRRFVGGERDTDVGDWSREVVSVLARLEAALKESRDREKRLRDVARRQYNFGRKDAEARIVELETALREIADPYAVRAGDPYAVRASGIKQANIRIESLQELARNALTDGQESSHAD